MFFKVFMHEVPALWPSVSFQGTKSKKTHSASPSKEIYMASHCSQPWKDKIQHRPTCIEIGLLRVNFVDERREVGKHTCLLTLQDPLIGSSLDTDFFHFAQELVSGTREGLTTFGMNPADRFSYPLNLKKECKRGRGESTKLVVKLNIWKNSWVLEFLPCVRHYAKCFAHIATSF